MNLVHEIDIALPMDARINLAYRQALLEAYGIRNISSRKYEVVKAREIVLSDLQKTDPYCIA